MQLGLLQNQVGTEVELLLIRILLLSLHLGNIRDYCDVLHLVVLANLEGINAELIRQGLSQSERLVQLNQIAIVQIRSLIRNASLKKLK